MAGRGNHPGRFSHRIKKAVTLARHEHLTGWLYATTTLIARRMLRDTRLRRAREQQAAAMNECHNNTQSRPAAHDLMREALDEALARLGEKDRAIVLMRFFDGRGFAEIGALMGITGDTARMRLNRALDKMRAIYARRGVASSAAALGAFMTAEAATAAPAGLAGSVSGAILAGGGAASVTTTAGILAFMTSTKMTVMATAAALIMATFATVEVWREKAAATGLAALNREHAALIKKSASTQTDVKEHRDKLANLRRQKAEVAEHTKNPRNPIEAGKEFIARHPEIQAILDEQRNARMADVYYPFYKKLNLAPEQVAEVVDLIGKLLIGPAIINRDIPGFGEIIFATGHVKYDQQAYNKLQELIGSDGIRTMNLCVIEMAFSRNLEKNLYYTDAPLTTDQMAQLSQQFYTLEVEKKLNDNFAPYWDAMQKQAGEFLSGPQMAALQQMREQKELRVARRNMEQAAAAEVARQPAANTGMEASQ